MNLVWQNLFYNGIIRVSDNNMDLNACTQGTHVYEQKIKYLDNETSNSLVAN